MLLFSQVRPQIHWHKGKAMEWIFIEKVTDIFICVYIDTSIQKRFMYVSTRAHTKTKLILECLFAMLPFFTGSASDPLAQGEGDRDVYVSIYPA